MRFRSLAGIAAIALVAIAVASAAPALVRPTATNGSVRVLYHVPPSINMTLTTNYQTGFGPQGGAGSGSTPAPGRRHEHGRDRLRHRGARLQLSLQVRRASGGHDQRRQRLRALRRGNVGLRRHLPAAELALLDALELEQHALHRAADGALVPEDAQPGRYGAGTASINYGGAAPGASAQIWQYGASTVGLPGGSASQGYDYQLDVPSATNISSYSIYVVYTAVAS